jgi:predicted DNA-binding transcriptional regulator YafY
MLHRLRAIEATLRNPDGPATAAQFARRLGVTRRTIQRDIDALRDDHGAPIRYVPARRSLVLDDPGWTLRPVSLSEGELLALALGAQLAGEYRGTPIGPAIGRVFEKLRDTLNEPVDLDPGALTEQVSFFGGAARPVDEQVWLTAARALREVRRLTIHYRAPGYERAAPAKLDPIHLACRLGDWYLIAWRVDGERPGERVYALSRVESATLLEERATPRPFDHHRDAAERFGRFIPGLGGAARKPLRVRLRFAPRVAGFALERVWHREQRAQRHRDGSATLTLPIPGFDEALAWVLRWGASAEVLGPPALREQAAHQAQEMARSYRGNRRRNGATAAARVRA